MPTRTTTDLRALLLYDLLLDARTASLAVQSAQRLVVARSPKTRCAATHAQIALLACLCSAREAPSAGYRPLRLLSVVDLGAAPALVTLA